MKKIPLYAGVIIILGSVFGAGYFMGENGQPAIKQVSSLENMEKDMPLGVNFEPFWRAWNILNDKFVPTSSSTRAMASSSDVLKKTQDKVWGAISGLTGSLGDPYTVFFPPEESKRFETEIAGSFEGVGMEVGLKDNQMVVIAPLKGTPAERAGVRSGDKILKIDETSTFNLSVDDAVKIIRGKKGTTVRLTVAREGDKEPREISIVRDTIDTPTVDTEARILKKLAPTMGSTTASGVNSDTSSTTKKTASSSRESILVKDSLNGVRDDGAYVIKLYSFNAQSPNAFVTALRSFVESGSHKLILDLRGNPGGYLEAAREIASYFLPIGDVVVTEDFGKNGGINVYRSKGYNVRQSVYNNNLQMVILINEGSASASEILAGALQEHGVAKLVGMKSFGKGSVQELVKLTPETSLKVTVARWLTPNGRSISAVGIAPDVEVKMTQADFEARRDVQMDKAVELLQNEK